MLDLIDRKKLLLEIESAENKAADAMQFERYSEMVKRQPTVDPDDFLAVMKTVDRMCASYACDPGCPFYDIGPYENVCGRFYEIFENPADFLAVIKEWAKEHPEMPCDAYSSGVCMSNGVKDGGQDAVL